MSTTEQSGTTNTQSSENVTMNIEQAKQNKTPQPPENITIPFILLTNLHNIMVAAGDRGAFKTAEMYDIGRVYKETQQYLTEYIRVAQAEEALVDASTLPEPEDAFNVASSETSASSST